MFQPEHALPFIRQNVPRWPNYGPTVLLWNAKTAVRKSAVAVCPEDLLEWRALRIWPHIPDTHTYKLRSDEPTARGNISLARNMHRYPIFFSLVSVSVLCRIRLNIHIYDCVETVYELPLLPNNTAVKHFYTNRERCKLLTGYVSLGGRRPGGEGAKRFTVLYSNRKQYHPPPPQLLPSFLPYRIPPGSLY